LTNFLVDIARTTVTPESSLVPYTTLFRSRNGRCRRQARRRTAGSAHTVRRRAAPQPKAAAPRAAARKWRRTGDGNAPRARQVASACGSPGDSLWHGGDPPCMLALPEGSTRTWRLATAAGLQETADGTHPAWF